MSDFWQNKKIVVTGGRGFVGKQVVRRLMKTRSIDKNQVKTPSSKTHDLRDLNATKDAIKGSDVVLHLAADVGGIKYSKEHPAKQFRNCILIDANIFQACVEENVSKLVATSSSVGYPENAPSPLKESDLFNGWPALSGYGYGFAKRNTVVLTKAYRQEYQLNAVALVPNNAYGPGERVDLESGHVIPSLIYKCLTQPKLNVWGDGSPIRDYLYVEDFAEAMLLAAEKLEASDPVNIGTGKGVSISKLVEMIVKLTNFKGEIKYDTSKPKGQKERVVDITRAKNLLGFSPEWSIDEGLKLTVEWIRSTIKK